MLNFTDKLRLITWLYHHIIGYILSNIENVLTGKQRQDIETRLANYNIPLQILQMVAEQCECTIENRNTREELALKPKLSLLLARLNDRAIILLQRIFLDCHESLSSFRFTVFLSSRYGPMMHKFVIDGKIRGKSNSEYPFDVCIYNRRTGDLIAVGMRNKDTRQHGSDSKSLSRFYRIVDDVSRAHPQLQGAYYSSSYGYQPSSLAGKNAIRKENAGEKVEIKFFEYRDKIYVENKSLSIQPQVSVSNRY
jgi:hypothetical protein